MKIIFMNQTHFHLVGNHVAILASLFSLVILIAGMYSRNQTLKRTALFGFVVSMLFAIPVYLTGETAEHSVKKIAGISKDLIHEHEESGELSIWFIAALGIVSLAGLAFMEKLFSLKKYFYGFTLIIGLVAAGSISYTGYLGGKIRHPEISADSNLAPATAPVAGQGEEQDED